MKKDIKKKKIHLPITVYFTLTVTLEIFASVVLSAVFLYVLNQKLGIELTFSPFLWVSLFSLFIGFLIAGIVNKKFLKPIKKLGDAMKCVADGDFDTKLETKSRINEIEEIYENFNLMTKELRATEVLQTDFISNVSHEIKTPVNAIEGYTTLLQSTDNIDEIEAEYIEKILINTKRLSELVGNILLISKIENQAIEKNSTKFRLDEQIRRSIMFLEPAWENKNIDFDVEMDSVVYFSNESILQHVWDNLISNAIKFNPEGGKIIIRLSESGDDVVFTVQDTGPGINADEEKHLFDKFYQGDTSHKQEGNGLGLSLVKKIVDSLKGKVSVQNINSGGCRFTVTLPNKLNGN